ncbi:MAG: hypothetical protein ACLS9K_06030 [Lachnospira eligens]
MHAMALVEAMYKKRNHFLYLMTHLSTLMIITLRGLMKLLDEIAKNYQVIYFTCSESRIHN